MRKKGEPAALPSKILQEKEAVSGFEELSEKERERIRNLMCQNMEKCLREYYSANPSEREDFAKAMQSITFCNQEVPMES